MKKPLRQEHRCFPLWALACLVPLSACNAQTTQRRVSAQVAPPATAAINAQSATIVVDAGARVGKVQPMVFGQNLEVGDSYQIYSDQHTTLTTRTGNGLWNPETHSPLPHMMDVVREIAPKMFRYPGGCLVHNLDWKKTIGPVAGRPDFLFGVDEFLRYCEKMGIVPLMQVSDYTGTAQDAADLVAYLNLPVSSGNVWAKRRAANGHPKPYNVIYFEPGNELDDGNHDMQPSRKFTAQEYAAWFNEYSQKMKAVDPRIKLSVQTKTGGMPDDIWNDVVLTNTKGRADFVVVHKYAIGHSDQKNRIDPAQSSQMMRATMASAEQLDVMLAAYRKKILRLTGKNLPLAITEYNALFVQPADDPLPLRYSLGSALFSADYLRVLMRPESNVLSASYWQMLNGYWGMMDAYDKQPIVRNPAFYTFRLWGQHFGPMLVSSRVNSPRINFEGLGTSVKPAKGDVYVPETVGTANLPMAWQAPQGAGFTTEVTGANQLKATLTDFSGGSFPSIATFSGQKGMSYILSFDARFTKTGGDTSKAHLGLGLVDTRGWDATKSAIGVEDIERAAEWRHFEGRFSTLADNTGISALWRLSSPASKISGTIEVKNIKIVTWKEEQFPGYAAITSAASLSNDGKKLYVMVFNKHHTDAVNTTLKIGRFPVRAARRWTVTGPSLEAHNREGETVKETESGVVVPLKGTSLTYAAPARSMTAWEFTR